MKWLEELLKNLENGEELQQKIAEKLSKEYVTKTDYDLLLEAKKGLEGQIAQRDNDIKELKEATKDNKDLQKKYEDLEKKYKTDTDNLQQKYHESRKNSAIDMEIMKAKGKNAKAIKALLDMEKITLNDDGTLKGLDLEELKKSDGYLFDIEETHIEGANGGTRGGFNTNSDDIRAQIEQSVFGQ